MKDPEELERERIAADRYIAFMERPEARDVALRYFLWGQTPIGTETMAKLNAFGVMRVQALVTKQGYDAALSELATETSVPLSDLRIMAEGAYEARRAYLIGTGQLPVAAGDWYPDGGYE